MRGRYTGLLLALILLMAAIPAVLDCCQHAHGSDRRALRAAPGSATLVRVDSVSRSTAAVRVDSVSRSTAAVHVADVVRMANAVRPANAPQPAPPTATRGCVEYAAPAQTPYIEPNIGSGTAPASTRNIDAATDPSHASHAAVPHVGRHDGFVSDATGPPLWLSTCVSRT
jgi:hypothetical protein